MSYRKPTRFQVVSGSVAYIGSASPFDVLNSGIHDDGETCVVIGEKLPNGYESNSNLKKIKIAGDLHVSGELIVTGSNIGTMPVLSRTTINLPTSEIATTTLLTSSLGVQTVVITNIFVRVEEPIDGEGSVTFNVSTTFGGQEIIVNQTLTSGSTGIVGGLSTSSLGSSMTADNGYMTTLSTNDEIMLICSPTGVVNSGSITAYVYGMLLL